MCGTRDLGIEWPQWHALMCEEQVAVDVSVVCPRDVENMLLEQTWMALLEEMGSKA